MSSELSSHTPAESVYDTEKCSNVDKSVPFINNINYISPTCPSKEYNSHPLNELPFSPVSVSKWMPAYFPGKHLTPTKAQLNINNEELTDENQNSSVASPSPYQDSSLATSCNDSGLLKDESPQTTPVIQTTSIHNENKHQNITFYQYKDVSLHSSKATHPYPEDTHENVLPTKFLARAPDRNDNVKTSSVKTGFTFRRHTKLQNLFSICSENSARARFRHDPEHVRIGQDRNISMQRGNLNGNQSLGPPASDLKATLLSKGKFSNLEIDTFEDYDRESMHPLDIQSRQRYRDPHRIQPEIITLKVAEERGDKKNDSEKDRHKHRKSDDSEDANDKRKRKNQTDTNEKNDTKKDKNPEENDKKKERRSDESDEAHGKRKRKSQEEDNSKNDKRKDKEKEERERSKSHNRDDKGGTGNRDDRPFDNQGQGILRKHEMNDYDHTRREHVDFDRVYIRNLDDPPSGLIHPVGSIRYDTPFPGIPIINRKDYDGKHFEVNQEYIQGTDVPLPNSGFGRGGQYSQGPAQQSNHLHSREEQQYRDYPERTSRLDVSINNRYHGSSSIGGEGGRDITNYDNYGGNDRMDANLGHGSQGSVFRDHDSNVNVYVNRSIGGDNGNGPNNGNGNGPNNGNGNGPNNNGNGYGPNNGNGYGPGNRGNPRGYGNGYGGDPNYDGMQDPYRNEGDEWYPNDNYGHGDGSGNGNCCPGPTPMPIPVPYPIPIFPPNPTPPCCCPRAPPKQKKKRKKNKKKSDSQNTEWNMLTMYGMYSLFHQMQTNWQAQIQETALRTQPQQQYGMMLGNPMQMMMSSMMGMGACGMSPQTQAQQPNPIFEVIGLDVNPTEEC